MESLTVVQEQDRSAHKHFNPHALLTVAVKEAMTITDADGGTYTLPAGLVFTIRLPEDGTAVLREGSGGTGGFRRKSTGVTAEQIVAAYDEHGTKRAAKETTGCTWREADEAITPDVVAAYKARRAAEAITAPVMPAAEELDAMTKAQLLAVAEEHGLASLKGTKAQIRAALAEVQA